MAVTVMPGVRRLAASRACTALSGICRCQAQCLLAQTHACCPRTIALVVAWPRSTTLQGQMQLALNATLPRQELSRTQAQCHDTARLLALATDSATPITRQHQHCVHVRYLARSVQQSSYLGPTSAADAGAAGFQRSTLTALHVSLTAAWQAACLF